VTTPAWSWTWDETLYAGSAGHYATGRAAYPAALAGAIRDELGLDGTGRLLDVGCGPGPLTTLLAPLFASAIGVDADQGMIDLARRNAPGIDWRCLRAEELPAGLGRFRAITFAQSFHWMDQPAVARAARDMLDPGGAWVHVGATTHRGIEGDDTVGPRPPWDEIDDLIRAYLGPARRAGRGILLTGTRPGEQDVMRAAGWIGPARRVVPQGVLSRSIDEVVSAVYSLSGSTPHLLGGRLAEFDADLRTLLLAAAPDGRFTERMREVEAVVWRL
jgi:SAM-dependent methyltransferase